MQEVTLDLFLRGFSATTHTISVPETMRESKLMYFILLLFSTVNYLNCTGT